MKKKICVLGLGYIGLPTAAMFATHGLKVIGVDTERRIIEDLNLGKIIIEEPYLDILVQAAVTSGNLAGKTRPEMADVFIIAVQTPLKPDKTADLFYVASAAESIVPYLRKGNLVVLESTAPTGTVHELLEPILARSGLQVGEELYVAHCPERVLPGRILIELVENNRIIGGINSKSAENAKKLYQIFVRGEIYLTNVTTTEMCKMMENTYRDVNIALANELAKICEQIGINAWEVIDLCNKHPRVNLHQPGPGVGGHCLAIDPWFIIEKAPDLAQLILLSRRTNDLMPQHVGRRVLTILKNIPKPKKVTVLGATYKPDINDARESPILELIEFLKISGIEITLYDPHLSEHPFLEKDLEKAVTGSDLLLLAVHHQVFKNIQFERVCLLMRNKLILDTRNFWDQKILEQMGFRYYLLGSTTHERLEQHVAEVAAAFENDLGSET